MVHFGFDGLQICFIGLYCFRNWVWVGFFANLFGFRLVQSMSLVFLFKNGFWFGLIQNFVLVLLVCKFVLVWAGPDFGLLQIC